jgi:ParB/RepB/Spo0J family partition protein
MKIALSQIEEPAAPLRAEIDEERLHELARSLQNDGQLQPIGVTPIGKNHYEIVFGHRRFLAAQINRWSAIEATIQEARDGASLNGRKLIENTIRENLNPVEEARALVELMEIDGVAFSDLPRRVSKGKAWVTQRLTLLSLPQDTIDLLAAGLIPLGIAINLGQIEDAAVRNQYLQAALNGGCTVESSKQWLYTYQLAAHGVAQAAANIAAQEEQWRESQTVDQMYNCFSCGDRKSYRRVNLLVVCRSCQDAIAETRETLAQQFPLPPLDHTPAM